MCHDICRAGGGLSFFFGFSFDRFSGFLLVRYLHTAVFNCEVFGEYQLGYGNNFIAILLECFDNNGQCLRGVKGGIVEQNYTAGLDF